MEDQSQPTATSAPQPASQQPLPAHTFRQPKKKRVGMIIGIVLGAIALISIITAVLLYFLWWQNPQKMLTDATANIINAKQAVINGQMTVKSGDVSLKMDFKSNDNNKDSAVDVTMKLKTEELSEDLELKLEGVYVEDGTVYVKAGGINKVVDDFLKIYLEMQLAEYGMDSTSISSEDMTEFEKQVHEVIDPIVEKIDNKWLKITASDFSDDESVECLMDISKEARSNEQLSQEIADAYKQHNFIIVKDTLESRDGAKGFEIDLDSQEARDKAKDFAEAVEDSELVKKIKECSEKSSSSQGESDNSEVLDDNTKGTLRVWVDAWSHQFTRIELVLKNKKEDTEITIDYDLKIGKSEKIDIPADAENAKDVISEIEEIFGGTTNLSSVDDELSI